VTDGVIIRPRRVNTFTYRRLSMSNSVNRQALRGLLCPLYWLSKVNVECGWGICPSFSVSHFQNWSVDVDNIWYFDIRLYVNLILVDRVSPIIYITHKCTNAQSFWTSICNLISFIPCIILAIIYLYQHAHTPNIMLQHHHVWLFTFLKKF
jgi:hypothetical protein